MSVYCDVIRKVLPCREECIRWHRPRHYKKEPKEGMCDVKRPRQPCVAKPVGKATAAGEEAAK